MKTQIGITDKNALAVADILNTLLADEYVIYTKTRNFHWNVTGMQFISLHKLLETHYEDLDEIIDDVAERTRSIGHFALGSLSDFLKVTNLTEAKGNKNDASEMLNTLVQDHETIIRIIRKKFDEVSDKYKDAGSADFITGIMEKHEKMA
jgi:starvation-inducible DNA-binding protein